jgi:hypothetical protein
VTIALQLLLQTTTLSRNHHSLPGEVCEMAAHGDINSEPRKKWHWGFVAATASLLTLAALALVVFWQLGSQGWSTAPLLTFAADNSATPSRLGATNGESVGGIVDSVFGTIQFAIAVLSGLVLVISVGVTYFMGRNARETQSAAREELRQVASLYRENIESLSNSIQTTTQRVIREYVNEGDPKRTVEEYAALHAAISAQYNDVKGFLDEITRAARDYEGLGTDYDGQFQQLSTEEDKFVEDEANQGVDFWGTAERRALLQQALLRLEDGALLRAVSSNTTFNSAQVAARAGLRTTSHRLATIAAWLEGKPLYRLRMFRSEFERSDRYTVEKADDGRFVLVNKNPDNDPEIAQALRTEAWNTIVQAIATFPSYDSHMLYSEVWNIFVHEGRFDEYIRVMKKAEAEAEEAGRYVPACLNASIARAWSLVGEPGWREQCIAEIRTTLAKMELESPGASWIRDTQRDLGRAMQGGQISVEEISAST